MAIYVKQHPKNYDKHKEKKIKEEQHKIASHAAHHKYYVQFHVYQYEKRMLNICVAFLWG